MKKITDFNRALLWSVPLLLIAFSAGCRGQGEGSRAPILGGGGMATLAPYVTTTAPLPNATSVPLNTTTITATFNEPVGPISGGASFTVTVAAPGVSPAGIVTLDATNRIASFTVTSAASLTPSTTYTGTVTGATSLATGLTMTAPYVWHFTTGLSPDTTRPAVTSTVPLTTNPGPTANVAFNTAISALFTEDMAPATINGSSFTVTGPSLTPVAGAVTYASRTGVFTPAAALLPSTTYTATITTAATDLNNNALAGNQGVAPAASNYVWTFRTGAAPDTTKPRVTSTIPATTNPGPTLNVPTNTAISATFSENMTATTINATNFKVTGPGLTVVNGAVTYASRVGHFAPAVALLANTTYTATVTQAATDLAGNHLAGVAATPTVAADYVWTFTTAAVPYNVPPTITLTNPKDLATGVALNKAVSATFSEAMDPLTLTTATFTLQLTGPPTGANLSGAVTYYSNKIATFTPSAPLLPNTSYTATITNVVKDLTGAALVAGLIPNPWTFTTGAAIVPPPTVPLGSVQGFGIMATLAITDAGGSFINGDVSLDPGSSCGLLPVQVNGTIHINDAISAQAKIDLLTLYNYLKALPSDATTPSGGDLGAWAPPGSTLPMGTLPPGVYTNGSAMMVATELTLDAGGDPNAIWVFQMGSSLTTTTPLGNITLANGAQAKNVYWVPTADATVGVNTIFNGTIVAGRDATGQTGAVLNGRILAGAITPGTIALDSNTVTVPAP